MIEELESLTEGITKELDDLQEVLNNVKNASLLQQLKSIINNIDYYNNKIYNIFESAQGIEEEMEEQQKENNKLKDFLLDKFDDLTLRYDYGIEL